ncbi:hypothetical protein [Paenibacillus odorifer]|uniref:hypothetical protein n=1 Tax=Paenibacillus odorifer TaxID=189426 RepID=UPI000BA12FDF|nr:hypothetical protein [Paenibacillus odorifer]OZQ66555.1 hypothetical protein CA596_27425 [Paenibacillus odorifer]
MTFEEEISQTLSQLATKRHKETEKMDNYHGIISNLLYRLQQRGHSIHLERDDVQFPNMWTVSIDGYKSFVNGRDLLAAENANQELALAAQDLINKGLKVYL